MMAEIFFRGENWNEVTKKEGKIDKLSDRVEH